MSQIQKEYLKARLTDAVHQCRLRLVPKFVGFLSEHEGAFARKIGKDENAKYMLFGGFSDAERTYFGVFPDWCEPNVEAFPIVRLKILNKSSVAFGHRDILGSILALGLERNTVGDIIVGDKESFVFVSASVSEYIIQQITKIASAGVEITVDGNTELPTFKAFQEKTYTIASARLDCVVAALCNLSRSSSLEIIGAGLVLFDGFEAEKPTIEVKSGTVISIRRYGKFVIDAISDKTKKGRTVLKYRKYI